MKFIRLAGIAFSLSLFLLLMGCGDTFRPVVTPIATPGGDPQASRTAFVLSHGVPQPGTETCADGSATPCTGASTEVNVPGDTNMGNRVQGREPWHAQIGTSAVSLYVANRASNTVTFYAPFLSGSAMTTISLPTNPDARPVFVHSTESTSMYVAESGRDKVGVISVGASQLSQEISVGTNPVALAETPDKSKLYVVNKGSGNVSVIASLDKKPLGTIAVGSNPVWAIATPDSKFVFVLNRGSRTVSVISTSINNTVAGEVAVGASEDVDAPLDNPMYYDSKAQRLYVVNSTDDTLSVFDTTALATNPNPVLVKQPIALPEGSGPVSVAALSDGSRIYTGNTNGTVTIIDARNLTVKRTIAVGPRVSAIAASPDASKIYATVPDSVLADGKVTQPAGVSVIATATDQPILNGGSTITIPAPFQDPVKCLSDNPLTWAASTAFALNAVVSNANGHFYRATTAGTSGTAEPSWCTDSGCQVKDDGTITWTEIGTTAPACPRQRPMWVLTSTP